ncbi:MULTISPECIES: HD domain-containing phosphohydrolase [unclassified Neptuniibacter]|jgi:response regulator RpfG family c-di-GMP phosphodiesterase|uniref:HD domain-containing phosphohydrolase n=1 Tax=unclassified Neptuniibacter TaxID=2630693 RepID=UPI0026E393FE|nr:MULTISPECIES: HD domain-containing phosphohydrolase [unclassified Neptuniibacter]MDO6515413.1 HD domain-containing phosphohydrolase [Neptuniibacter sp. 2_MG-2023]MDO6595166.1 HD domain-containing phosphohydrolase [Neptuniibacter sp. 1_MG-2023]
MKIAPTSIYHSLRFQITVVIVLLIGVLLINTLFSFYSENQRRHDYDTLQSSGTTQQLFSSLISRSSQYAEAAPRDWETYFRDLGMYGQDLNNIILKLDNTLSTLTDLPDLQQQWKIYSQEIHTVRGDLAEPKLESVAHWVVAHQQELNALSGQIDQRIKTMLDQQLKTQRQINIALFTLSLLVGLSTLFALNRLFSRPLQTILSRLQHLAQGKTVLDETIDSRNEMGTIYSAIDDLALNLNTTFNLTRNVNQATSVDSALCFVYEEYQQRLPIDALCLIRDSNDGQSLLLERVHSDKNLQLKENSHYSKQVCELCSLFDLSEPLLWQEDQDWDEQHSELAKYLHNAGINSALFFPFNNQSGSILVFASTVPSAFNEKHLRLLKNAGGQLQHAFEKTELVESLVISAVSGLSKLAESRDPETGDHLARMSQYSMILAEELSHDSPYEYLIDNRYIRDILRFSPMHDIGKVGIADSILLKPGRLTSEERHDMEFHPAIGGEVLKRCEEQLNASGHSMFATGIEIAEGHHEKWDGSGYPHGWKEKEIPLSARIVAVADVFDALTSKRPYKEAWPVEKALKLFDEESGKHFDPEIIKAFHRALPKILEIYERLKHV